MLGTKYIRLEESTRLMSGRVEEPAKFVHPVAESHRRVLTSLRVEFA